MGWWHCHFAPDNPSIRVIIPDAYLSLWGSYATSCGDTGSASLTAGQMSERFLLMQIPDDILLRRPRWLILELEDKFRSMDTVSPLFTPELVLLLRELLLIMFCFPSCPDQLVMTNRASHGSVARHSHVSELPELGHECQADCASHVLCQLRDI